MCHIYFQLKYIKSLYNVYNIRILMLQEASVPLHVEKLDFSICISKKRWYLFSVKHHIVCLQGNKIGMPLSILAL